MYTISVCFCLFFRFCNYSQIQLFTIYYICNQLTATESCKPKAIKSKQIFSLFLFYFIFAKPPWMKLFMNFEFFLFFARYLTQNCTTTLVFFIFIYKPYFLWHILVILCLGFISLWPSTLISHWWCCCRSALFCGFVFGLFAIATSSCINF